VANKDQLDTDKDGKGDACDPTSPPPTVDGGVPPSADQGAQVEPPEPPGPAPDQGSTPRVQTTEGAGCAVGGGGRPGSLLLISALVVLIFVVRRRP
jgi:hypothetical protein